MPFQQGFQLLCSLHFLGQALVCHAFSVKAPYLLHALPNQTVFDFFLSGTPNFAIMEYFLAGDAPPQTNQPIGWQLTLGCTLENLEQTLTPPS